MLLLVAGALTNLLPNIKDDKMLSSRREIKPQGKSTLDSFTVIMQTYNRTDLLLRLLNHYQAIPHLHKVIVVWNNVGEKGPDEVWNSLGPHPVPVIFKVQTTNRMRNRLQVFPEVETNGKIHLACGPEGLQPTRVGASISELLLLAVWRQKGGGRGWGGCVWRRGWWWWWLIVKRLFKKLERKFPRYQYQEVISLR